MGSSAEKGRFIKDLYIGHRYQEVLLDLHPTSCANTGSLTRVTVRPNLPRTKVAGCGEGRKEGKQSL